MAYEMKPLSCSPSQLKGFSEKLIVSHYENNYGGAVKLGTASILIGAGALGVLLFHSRAKGALALCAVIGVLLVTLAQMAPHALPDPVAGAIFALAAAALLGWNVGPLKLMLAGALSERLSAFSFATR